MAFALAIKAAADLPDDNSKQIIPNATFLIVLVTVLFNGGTCTFMLDTFNLRDPAGGEGGVGGGGNAAGWEKGGDAVKKVGGGDAGGVNGLVAALDEKL